MNEKRYCKIKVKIVSPEISKKDMEFDKSIDNAEHENFCVSPMIEKEVEVEVIDYNTWVKKLEMENSFLIHEMYPHLHTYEPHEKEHKRRKTEFMARNILKQKYVIEHRLDKNTVIYTK